MTKIDWSGELEAVSRDNNEVHALDPMRPNDNRFWPFVAYSQSRGEDFYLNPDEHSINSGNSTGNWYIRNRQPATNDRLTRLEAFVARVANGPFDGDFHREAKVLVAELNPVDPDEAIAKTMALDAQDDFLTPLASARLERLERHMLSAIKRGRALERGES